MSIKDLTEEVDAESKSSFSGRERKYRDRPSIPDFKNHNVFDFLINYNEKFTDAPPTLFRDATVRQTMSILLGKSKPNAILVGQAGTGKTKIVEEIARMLSVEDPLIPDKLKNSIIYELPLSSIISGSCFQGQLEAKLESVVKFTENPENNAILFIDEIHQLTGKDQSCEKMAQILKPALARGDMRVIGATTTQEYGDISRDPAFKRRFSRVIVDELSKEQTRQILKHVKPTYLNHYNINSNTNEENTVKITFDDDIIPDILSLADEYKTAGAHRPDNALTLLDRALGDSILYRKKMEKNLVEDPEKLAELQGTDLVLTAKQLKMTALRIMTGNAKQANTDIEKLQNHCKEIQGQEEAVSALIGIIKRHELNIFPRKQPTAILLAGPSGAGKTEITKIIAAELTDAEPITLNMTEFAHDSSLTRIIGSPEGYVGFDSHHELPFDSLDGNPYQVILLDEFEKCGKAVQRLFMSAFDEGHVKTTKGKYIDFSRSVMIATTNAGFTDKGKNIGFTKSETTKSTTVSDLSKSFDVELLNRFQHIIPFQPISVPIFKEIFRAHYARELLRMEVENPGVRPKLLDDIPEETLEELTKQHYVSDFGARPVPKLVREYIENQVMEE